MKILVIFTGGTIGSLLRDGWISPDAQTKSELIQHYVAEHGSDIEFVTENPYSILSENLSAEQINILVKAVSEAAEGDYDGIIVTHGTDTLQYSAAALSYGLGDRCIPVLLVSSNYPLGDSRTNGHINFLAAVEFIKQKKGNGVFVVYRNDDSPVCFHKGLSLLCHREADDSIYSLYRKPYAEYDNGKITVFDDEKSVCEKKGAFILCNNPGILVSDARPGECYQYDLKNINAVIFRPYHSGTLNTANEDFVGFCSNAAKLNIPVFVINIKEGDAYASSKEFDSLKIHPIYDSTFVSIYMRLWIAISRGDDPRTILKW